MAKKKQAEVPTQTISPADKERFDRLQAVLKDSILPIIKGADRSAYEIQTITQVFGSSIQGAAMQFVSKKQLGELDITAHLIQDHPDYALWTRLIDALGHLTVSDAQLVASKLAQLVDASISERAKDVKIAELKIIGLE